MKHVLSLFLVASLAAFAGEPTVIVNRVDMAKLRQMEIPAIPADTLDQIQVIVRPSGPGITAIRLTAEVLVDTEVVKVNQIQDCQQWNPLFVIQVKSAIRARIVSLQIAELTVASVTERSDF